MTNSGGGTQVRHEDGKPVLANHRLRLRVVSGPDEGRRIDISAASVTVGTAENCDLKLTDPTVSRHHCEIAVEGDGYRVRDLDSTNGTYLDDDPIELAELHPGGTIGLGGTDLVFEAKKRWVRVERSPNANFGAVTGKTPVMRALFGLLERAASTRLSCIIYGETGTGKDLVARSLHERSDRSHGPFIVVDCGSISESLIESELFGHERGAFTGAERARAGAFELANSGTLFLDEVGELPLEMQPKLLRALEHRGDSSTRRRAPQRSRRTRHLRHPPKPRAHGRARHLPRGPLLSAR